MSERLVSTGNEFHPSESVKNVMKLGLPTSNSLFMIPSEIEEPNVIKKEISSASFPTERFVKAEKEKNGIPNIFGPVSRNNSNTFFCVCLYVCTCVSRVCVCVTLN